VGVFDEEDDDVDEDIAALLAVFVIFELFKLFCPYYDLIVDDYDHHARDYTRKNLVKNFHYLNQHIN
jgi:hypothetical protein